MLLGLMFVLSFVPVSCGGDSDDDGLNPNLNSKESKSKFHKGHEYVDLGLSVKWATCNVGAKKPEDLGGYYAWGEIEEKSEYDWDTYKWGDDNNYSIMTKYCTERKYGRVDNKTVLDPEDDVAHVKWGGSWRMPTSEELKELAEECNWQSTSLNDVEGYKVTGPNGNSIFLPAAGYRYGTEINSRWSDGCYWSSSLNDGSCVLAYCLWNDDWDSVSSRYDGLSVRPVLE